MVHIRQLVERRIKISPWENFEGIHSLLHFYQMGFRFEYDRVVSVIPGCVFPNLQFLQSRKIKMLVIKVDYLFACSQYFSHVWKQARPSAACNSEILPLMPRP